MKENIKLSGILKKKEGSVPKCSFVHDDGEELN
jgi:hypothetical protein